MPVYYPQGVMTLRVALEDFNDKTSARLAKLHVFSVICKSVNVNLNSYREADTFDAEIDFKNFPFDPRAIRSLGVTIHIEDRKKLFKTNNSKNLIDATAESTVFQGFADTDNISLSEDSRTVRLEGRDFTSLLIDREYLGDPVALSKPLDQVLRLLLDQIEETKIEGPNTGIEIDNQVVDSNGNPVAVLPTLAQLGADLNSKAGTRNGRPRRTYWDMIQNIVADAGLIAFISLDKLVISSPRTLYNKSKSKIFIFGENLKTLDFERKIGRQKGFNIRVLALVTERKEVIDIKIPEEATDSWINDIGIPKKRIQIPQIKTNGEQGEPKDAPFITFRLRNIADKDHLRSVGEKIFEEIGRQQIEGELETSEMVVCEVSDNKARPDFFDATKFRVGTPIELDINQGDLQGLPDLRNISNETTRKNRIKKFLIRNCYNTEVATAFAESLSKYDTPFFTKEVSFSLNQDSGFSMRIGFINFIEIPKNLAQREV